jgi:hypothetical protein
MFRKIIFISLISAGILSCKSKTENTSSDSESRDTDSAQVSVFPNEIPAPPNEKFNTKTIDVSNFEGLYNNLGSNRTLRLTADIIIPSSRKNNSNVNVEVKFGVEVRGISNLKIIGAGPKPARLIQPDPIRKVMHLYKCENIVFENIEAGHEPEKGSCAASVLAFDECHDIFINSSILYGSGYEGITAYKVQNLNCKSTLIKGCSFRILSLSQSSDVRFYGCFFEKNAEPNGAGRLYLVSNDRVVFHDCTFRDNSAYIKEANEEAFFRLQDCTDVYAWNCSFANNKAKYFVTPGQELKERNNKSKNNTWDNKPI